MNSYSLGKDIAEAYTSDDRQVSLMRRMKKSTTAHQTSTRKVGEALKVLAKTFLPPQPTRST